jgi:hypothetical protein
LLSVRPALVVVKVLLSFWRMSLKRPFTNKCWSIGTKMDIINALSVYDV